MEEIILTNEDQESPEGTISVSGSEGIEDSGLIKGLNSRYDESAPQGSNPAGAAVQELLDNVIKDYEVKFNELKAATEKAIAERDEMIRSLLNGKKPQLTVADKINTQRNFKKW